ncbi:hypothetical protein H4R19_001642 [Coemansia spiralis]|nr:hypothetical protein H4R19_001642 [Coemansia spiralis]
MADPRPHDTAPVQQQLVPGISMASQQRLFQANIAEMTGALLAYLQTKRIRGASLPMAGGLLEQLKYKCNAEGSGKAVGFYELAVRVHWEGLGLRYLALFAHISEKTLVVSNFSSEKPIFVFVEH